MKLQTHVNQVPVMTYRGETSYVLTLTRAEVEKLIPWLEGGTGISRYYDFTFAADCAKLLRAQLNAPANSSGNNTVSTCGTPAK